MKKFFANVVAGFVPSKTLRSKVRKSIINESDFPAPISDSTVHVAPLSPTTNDLLLAAGTERFNQIMFSHPDYRRVIPLLKRIESSVSCKMVRIPFPDSKNLYDMSYRMSEKFFPWSCTTEEGIVMMGTILENNLQSGFEIATAFGHSSLFIASAFAQTGGHLVTMDCYVEEGKEDYNYTLEELEECVKNTRKSASEGILPYGLRKAKENAYTLGLNNIEYVIGISPQDVSGVVREKLDFVFIDGGHFGDQPSVDFDSIKERMADNFAIFFHDNHNTPAVMNAVKKAEGYFATKATETWSHWNLTVVSRGIRTDFIDEFIKTRT